MDSVLDSVMEESMAIFDESAAGEEESQSHAYAEELSFAPSSPLAAEAEPLTLMTVAAAAAAAAGAEEEEEDEEEDEEDDNDADGSLVILAQPQVSFIYIHRYAFRANPAHNLTCSP